MLRGAATRPIIAPLPNAPRSLGPKPLRDFMRIILVSVCVLVETTARGADAPRATQTPIEHLIVVVGENLRVDNLFGVYEPRSGEWPVPDHQTGRQ